MVTIIMSTSLLFGCASTTQQEAQNLIQETPTVEVVVNEPIEETTTPSENTAEQLETLAWIEVGKLETSPDLRKAFDEIFGVTGEAGSKTGWAYTTQNITLKDALEGDNGLFVFTPDLDEYSKIASLADDTFVDADDATDSEKVSLVLNEYFNLLPEEQAGYSNPYSELTRAQAMTLLMRAITPVKEITTDEDFATAVGESEYNQFAQEVNEMAFINTLDGSLTSDTYNKPMTKAEAVYLIAQAFYKNEYDANMYAGSEMQFTDLSENTELSGATNIELLNSMLENGGVDNRIIDAYQIANYHHLYNSDVTESEWNESITKAEFISLIVNANAPEIEEIPAEEADGEPFEAGPTPTEEAVAVPTEQPTQQTTQPAQQSTSKSTSTSLRDYNIDTDHLWWCQLNDPSQLTEDEATFLMNKFPGFPKDPRQMTLEEFTAYMKAYASNQNNTYSNANTTSTTPTEEREYTDEELVAMAAANGLTAATHYDDASELDGYEIVWD